MRRSVAEGEIRLSVDMLQLLSTSAVPTRPSPIPNLPSGTLTGSLVSRPDPIPSVQRFNEQLTLGAKDKALRRAADVLRDAAKTMERTRKRDESYWIGALTARAANWGIVPAPLPPGAPLGKNAIQEARDFAIAFGLEECMSHLFHVLALTVSSCSPARFQAKGTRLSLRYRLRCLASGFPTSAKVATASFTQEDTARRFIHNVSQHTPKS
jgi:hypothetical protein